MATVEVLRPVDFHNTKHANGTPLHVAQLVATQPDIEYHPNELKWKARTARRLVEDPTLLTQPLPDGFPQKLISPLVWEGKDWKDESQWVYNLSQEQLEEIDQALRHFKGFCFTLKVS
jgi:hypothetical protein